MRKLSIVLVPLLIVALVMGAIGCGDTCTVCGVYLKQDDPTLFLEVNSDSTFVMGIVNGKWHVSGSEIIFTTVLGAFTGRVEGSRIIFGDSDVYVKKGT